MQFSNLNILYSKNAKGAWEELQKVHAPKDRQWKYSLLRSLYRLDMQTGSSLREHEQRFDILVQSLEAIGKTIEPDEVIILYANSLPVETFGNWIQSQLGFIDNISITDFKGRVREEARRLNLVGMGQGLGVEDADTVQANFVRHKKPGKKYPPCGTCGYTNHAETDCHKRIAEEYIAKQMRRQQNPDSKRSRNHRNHQQQQGAKCQRRKCGRKQQ